MENEKKGKGHIIRIGPLLKEVLEKQKARIRDLTYDVCESSDFEAGEIIAKKILDNRLL